ncbi:FHA domain-containing protein [Comamonas odontotermitis]|uniref:FHA domain-containing protein n=1 Tax=Comamonas odontotermitis TaxID=379895 RepID=UPI0037519C32
MSEHDYPELTEVAPDTEMAALDAAAPAQPAAAPPEGAVLELVERGHRLALALPVFAWPCTIGRAATADLVLTDASIAPEHVRLHRNGDGQYEIEVLDSVNGIWLGKRHYSAGERCTWTPGTRLVLGRGVQLALRTTAQPLAPTQRWRPFSRAQGVLTAFALVALALLAALETWLGATETGTMARQLPSMLLWLFGGLLVWSLLWSLMGKLFTGSTAFWRHVCIASVGMVATALVGKLLSASAFALSIPLLSRFDSSVAVALLVVVLWFHLRAATQVGSRTLAIAMLSLLVLGVGAKLGLQWQSQKRLGDGLYMSNLLPPQWRMAPTVPVDRFVQGTDAIRQQLQTRSQLEKDEDEDGAEEDSGLD